MTDDQKIAVFDPPTEATCGRNYDGGARCGRPKGHAGRCSQVSRWVNKEDLGWTPPDNLDEECLLLCRALNDLPGIETTASCSGHGKEPLRIWFQAQTIVNLFVLARALSTRYYETADLWACEIGDTDLLDQTPFVLTSRRPVTQPEADAFAASICDAQARIGAWRTKSRKHAARINHARTQIVGCVCGWQMPSHVGDSDTAFAEHLAIALAAEGETT